MSYGYHATIRADWPGVGAFGALMARPIRRGRRGEYKEMLERSMKHETHRDDQTGG